jgi:hypothetical protein
MKASSSEAGDNLPSLKTSFGRFSFAEACQMITTGCKVKVLKEDGAGSVTRYFGLFLVCLLAFARDRTVVTTRLLSWNLRD